MKKILFLAIASVFALATVAPVQAQTPFFMNKQGAEAEYALKDDKGNITSYSKSVVTELSSSDPRNFTITYSTEVFDKNRRSLAAAVTSTVTVENGAVLMAPVMENVEIEGSLPSFPADISVGQVLEYEYSIRVMGMRSTTTGKNTVVARESVTTPAGTFDCFKVEGEVSARAMMQTTKTKTITWLAPGIGTVKSEIYDNRDRLQSSQELISNK